MAADFKKIMGYNDEKKSIDSKSGLDLGLTTLPIVLHLLPANIIDSINAPA